MATHKGTVVENPEGGGERAEMFGEFHIEVSLRFIY
jgi:hypothetical protein